RVHAEYQRGQFFDESLQIERIGFKNYISKIWILISEDGINFNRYHNTLIKGDGTSHEDFFHGIEDVRITKTNGQFLLIGCGKILPPFQGQIGVKGDRIAIYSTLDFIDIDYHGIIEDIDVRNTVIFPESVSGKYYILLRFGKNIHIDVLEAGMNQLLHPSNYCSLWDQINNRRKKTKFLEAGSYPHEKEKIGPGPPPIRTEKGWLIIYHAVGEVNSSIARVYGLSQKINRSYSICAAILDLHNPSKVLCRTKYPIYIPSKPWELYGNEVYPVDIPAVVFPMGSVIKDNKIFLYTGAGDKYIILLSSRLDSLIEYLWSECRL
ncbi:MAG: glycoside hydrolase family 130 protein, partial [Candidatus Hodarchaeales archaeon]